jgi:hypothetical protein
MKKLNLAALLVGATLFTGLGTTCFAAEVMKCGAGKCGSSTPAVTMKCSGDKNMSKSSSKCSGDKKMPVKAAKCGGDKTAPIKADKCN